MDPVSDKNEVLQRLAANASAIRAFGVVRLGLFGSFVRNTMHAESDVDLLVEFDPAQKTLRNLVRLSAFLQSSLGRKVELVTPQSLNPFTGQHIINEVEDVAFAA